MWRIVFKKSINIIKINSLVMITFNKIIQNLFLLLLTSINKDGAQ